MSSAKAGLILPVAIVILAYLYNKRTDDVLKERLDQVLSGLLRAERKVAVAPKTKVAVGFGSCEDVFVNATEFLVQFGASPPAVARHHDFIQNLSALEEEFAFFFKSGAAAERYVSDFELFKRIVEFSQTLPSARWGLGGNAPVMANRFAAEGYEVLLGGKVSEKQTQQMHKNVKPVGGNFDPDIHFVMEYDVDDRWGKYKSPRANRFIIHSDVSNPAITTLEDFSAELQKFAPSLFVVGGLQMLDNFPFKEGQRSKRLQDVEKVLATISQDTRIHFEMASFTDKALLQDIVQHILPYSDSLGMNEQELPNLLSILTDGEVISVADSNPRLASVLDQIREVFQILRSRKLESSQRQVTRLHIHTLANQIILTVKGSSWKNAMSASAKAALMANRHICGNTNIDINEARIIMDDSFATSKASNSQRIDFDNNRPVACWEEMDYEICVAPVLVCTNVKQTAGGGDNISSAGLVLQV